MSQTLVLTVYGLDRAGLLASISRVVSSHQGNWEGSQLTRLGGQFAGILKVGIESDRVEGLAKELQNLGPDGLTVILHNRIVNATTGKMFWIELVGQDQPNIVHRITDSLATHEVSVTELSSELLDAPHGGGRLFKLQAAIRCPNDFVKEKLSESLENLANSLMVDIQFVD